MWKLLSKMDRKNVNANEQSTTAPRLVVLTTAGFGSYSCAGCSNYGVAGQGPDPETSCASAGVPPDAMPCSWSAKQPGHWFRPLPQNAAASNKIMERLSLEQLLVLNTLIPPRIELLVEQHKLSLPYGPGDTVNLVHNSTLVEGVVVNFGAENVVVTVADETLSLPHTAVIPKRKNATGYTLVQASNKPPVPKDSPIKST